MKVLETLACELSRNVNISAVHVALKRLTDKGFVKSKFGGKSGEEFEGRVKSVHNILKYTPHPRKIV